LAFSTALRTLTKVSKFYSYNNRITLVTPASQKFIYTSEYIYVFKASTQYNLATTANYTDYTISVKNQIAEVLLVGGGGGGGTSLGAGGGAGGLVYVPVAATFILNGTYKIRVGSGGLNMQGSLDTTTINGTDSTIFDSGNNVILRAIGGAMGNGQSTAYNGVANRTSAGNAAGGCRHAPTPAASAQKTGTTGLSSSYGYCNNAGTGNTATYNSGGGGGAGGAGVNADNGGTGGAAFSCPITGATVYYAAGGGGSTNAGGNPTGGYGGTVMVGGQGNGNGNGGDGMNDTGSGGGGGNNGVGGRGSAGICIIKLRTFPTIVSNGVSVNSTYMGGATFYYTFTSTSGTNTINFPTNTICQLLIVGGGGAGGGGFGGAGGAGGGIYYKSAYTFNSGTYTIIIGSGGTGGNGYSGGTPAQAGSSGGQSIIKFNNANILTVNGGGGGDSCGRTFTGVSGGSTSANINGVITNYSGGSGYASGGAYNPGGGAGAGGNGASATGSVYGNGGNGYYSTISGLGLYYAGGGAGVPASVNDTPSVTNGAGSFAYGGGGRGGWADNVKGSNGVSGCVIITYTIN